MALRHVTRGSMFGRILFALDTSMADLAEVMGVSVKELESFVHLTRGHVVETDMDEMWLKLEAHLALRIGELFSIREEISRKRAVDHRQRMERLARMRDR